MPPIGVGPCAPPPLCPEPPATLLPPPVLEGGADFPPLLPELGVDGRAPCDDDVPEREPDAGVPTPDLGTAELVIGVGTRDIGLPRFLNLKSQIEISDFRCSFLLIHRLQS